MQRMEQATAAEVVSMKIAISGNGVGKSLFGLGGSTLWKLTYEEYATNFKHPRLHFLVVNPSSNSRDDIDEITYTIFNVLCLGLWGRGMEGRCLHACGFVFSQWPGL